MMLLTLLEEEDYFAIGTIGTIAKSNGTVILHSPIKGAILGHAVKTFELSKEQPYVLSVTFKCVDGISTLPLGQVAESTFLETIDLVKKVNRLYQPR